MWAVSWNFCQSGIGVICPVSASSKPKLRRSAPVAETGCRRGDHLVLHDAGVNPSTVRSIGAPCASKPW